MGIACSLELFPEASVNAYMPYTALSGIPVFTVFILLSWKAVAWRKKNRVRPDGFRVTESYNSITLSTDSSEYFAIVSTGRPSASILLAVAIFAFSSPSARPSALPSARPSARPSASTL